MVARDWQSGGRVCYKGVAEISFVKTEEICVSVEVVVLVIGDKMQQNYAQRHAKK